MPDPVLAISPANDRMHVGAAATVLSHVTAETQQGHEIDWDYFDSHGTRLVAAGGVLEPADPAAALPLRPTRQILVARIDLVLAHAQLRLDLWNDALIAGEEQINDGDPVRMLRVQGELADVLTMLAALVPDLDPSPHNPDPGDWWHYFWAH